MVPSIYLRLSVTDRCNLRCVYCRPRNGGRAMPRSEELTRQQVVACVEAIHRVVPVRKVRFTGGEPLLRDDLPEIVRDVRALLPEATLGLTTNGMQLAANASRLRAAGLDALNVSLDAMDATSFAEVTGGGKIEPVLAGIRAARDAGFSPLKLNAVLLATHNGEQLTELVRLAATHGAEPRFIELMPSGPGAALHAKQFLSASDAVRRLSATMQYEGPLGQAGTATRHRFRDGDRIVVVGFITPVSKPFCAGCDRLRLDAHGSLFGCLRRTDRIDLAALLHAGDRTALHDHLTSALRDKMAPPEGWLSRDMAAIGG